MFHASCPGLCQPRLSGQRPCDQEFELPVSSHNRWMWHALQRHRYRRTCHGWWSRDTGGIWRWSTLQSATRASAALKMPKCSFVRTPLDGRKKSFSLREFLKIACSGRAPTGQICRRDGLRSIIAATSRTGGHEGAWRRCAATCNLPPATRWCSGSLWSHSACRRFACRCVSCRCVGGCNSGRGARQRETRLCAGVARASRVRIRSAALSCLTDSTALIKHVA